MVTTEQKYRDEAFSALAQRFLDKIPSTASATFENPQLVPRYVKTCFTLPISVNYVAQTIPTVPYTHPDNPKLLVCSRSLIQQANSSL
jgi:Zn-dependent M16 (insulinase) family peptidase